MKANINYSDGETIRSSERFLSKEELRRIFGAGVSISLTITYRKRRFRVSHSNEGHCAMKTGYPVFRQKAREIEL
jgi:hypothetical protein